MGRFARLFLGVELGPEIGLDSVPRFSVAAHEWLPVLGVNCRQEVPLCQREHVLHDLVPEHAREVYCEIILKGNRALADYLYRQSESGAIRTLQDPFLTARAFIGLLLNYPLTQELLGGKDVTPIRSEDWIREAVQVFLVGIKN